MIQLTLNIPENNFNFFLELVQNLSFEVKIHKTSVLSPAQQEFVDDIKHALNQVELHRQGKIKLKSAKELLNEI